MQTSIEIIKGDITKLKVDAIVNAANKSLLGGGGVDGAIHHAAGWRLLKECQALGGCETGQAKITRGYDLPAQFIIHIVGPVWSGGKNRESELLSLCYANSLELAKNHGLESIAFPSISTGAYHFPIEKASLIALETTKLFLEKYPMIFKKVIFVLFSDGDFKIYSRLYRK